MAALKLEGGVFQSFSNQNDRVNPAAVLELAGGGFSPVYRSVRPADEGTTNAQHFAGLAAHPGLATLESTGGNGVTELLFGTYDREGSLCLLYTSDAADE